jgi:hypothetical protein
LPVPAVCTLHALPPCWGVSIHRYIRVLSERDDMGGTNSTGVMIKR